MSDRLEPFDDFEFKPLTEGLGFHKKAEKIRSDIKASQLGNDVAARTMPSAPPRSLLEAEAPSSLSAPGFEAPRQASQSISDLIASLPPSLDFLENKNDAAEPESYERPQIFQPIAREEFKAPLGPTVGSVLPTPGSKAGGSLPLTSPYRERMNESYSKAFPHASPQTQTRKQKISDAEASESYQPVSVNLASTVLDGMVAIGLSTILLVSILAITRINLMGLLNNAQTDGPTQMHLVLLFLATLQIYMLTARSFFGASLGEWAFDIQLGKPEDQQRVIYPLQVAARTLLITITGLILVPLLSFVFRRDFGRYLSGLQLFQRS
jgi:hypothetical protein